VAPHKLAEQGIIFGEAPLSVTERVAQMIMSLRRNPHNRAIQRYIYLVGDHELTPVQVDILETVVDQPGQRMTELARNLGVDASTLSRTIRPLIKLCLIERCQDEKDKRLTILTPTPEGLKQAHLISHSRRAMMFAVQGHLPDDRLALFADLLEEYIDAVNTEGSKILKSGKKPRARAGGVRQPQHG